MRHERIIGMVLAGLTLVWQVPATGAGDLTLEALPVSAGAVELRWNEPVAATIERRAGDGAFETVTRTALNAGTLGNVPMQSYFDRGLAADTAYTYRLVVPNGWHYDFGPKAEAAAADHLRVSGAEVFTESGGFGFEKASSDGTVGHSPRPRESTFANQSVPFIQRVPNGHYLIGAGGELGQFVINGTEVKTEPLYRNIREITDVPIEVTDGRLVVDPRGARFAWLNIVPRDEPVRILASASCQTLSIPHMLGIMGDAKKPMPDRLAALYSLGDMRASASSAAPKIAEVLLKTEQDQGPMHLLAVWSLWKIGAEHVKPGQRAAVETILARFATYNRALLPAPARAVIQEANAERPLFGQYQMVLSHGKHGEKLPPRVSDEAFFGRWETATGDWAIKPVVQYDFSPNLNATLEAAKRGDYDAAKAALLEYYRNREAPPRPDVAPLDEAGSLAGEAALRGVAGLDIRGTLTVRGDWQWYTVELPGNKVENVYLISDWDRTGLVGIRSRENKGYAPRLEIVTDTTKHVLEAEGDTFVRGGEFDTEERRWVGEYVGVNYGTNEILMVQEGPTPEGPNSVSDETMRTYLNFNVPASISSGEEKVQSQTLHLYAKPLGERKEVGLAVFGRILPSIMQGREKTLTWSNHTIPLFIYKDIDFDRYRPPGGETQSQYWFPRGAFSGGAVHYARTSNEQYAYNAMFTALDFGTKQRASHYYRVDTGRRLILSPQMLHTLGSEFMTPEVWTSLLKVFYEHARVLTIEPGNAGNSARSIQYGWLLYNTYYPEVSQPGWWELNTARQAENVRNTLFADGSNTEATSGYIRGTMIAMKESVELVKKVRGILIPGAEPYGQLAEYYMNLTTPAGTCYDWGDGTRFNVRDDVLAAGELLDNPHLIYVGSKGERGTEPPYHSRLYPVGKTFTMRTSWIDENGLGAFINARAGGGHSHRDDLNLDIYGYGRYLLADPGNGGTYDSSNPAAAWSAGTTIAHNTIVIDGQNQARGGGIKSHMGATANRVFDHVEAWTETYGNARRVYRRVLFVRPSYWIVSDYIRAAEGEHTYDQAWHPEEGANPTIDPETQRMRTRFAAGGNVQVVQADPGELKANILDGWMEGRQAKYVTFRKAGVTGDTTFDTVIYPTPEGDNTVVSVERLAVKGPDGALAVTNATALKITIGKDRTGYYFQSYLEKPATVEFGGISFDGETAYVELDDKGAVTYAALRNGSRLTRRDGRNVEILVTAQAVMESLGFRLDDGTLHVESSDKRPDLTIHAPKAVDKAILNGEAVHFMRENGQIKMLLSGGLLGVSLPGVDVQAVKVDTLNRKIRILVGADVDVTSLAPQLELSEGYSVTTIKEAGADAAMPYQAGKKANFTNPVQYAVEIGSGQAPAIWTAEIAAIGKVINIAGRNETIALTYNHRSSPGKTTVNYELNGATLNEVPLSTFATVSGAIDVHSFGGGQAGLGFWGYWGAARTGTVEWTFAARSRTGKFKEFVFNPGTSQFHGPHNVTWQVRLNDGEFLEVWKHPEGERVANAQMIDLTLVNGENLLADDVSEITIQARIHQGRKDKDGGGMAAMTRGDTLALTIKASTDGTLLP